MLSVIMLNNTWLRVLDPSLLRIVEKHSILKIQFENFQLSKTFSSGQFFQCGAT
jgi:hypothetical protein